MTRYLAALLAMAALQAIATRAIPREQLQAEGYRSLAGSSDLFRHGYFVRHWYRISDQREVLADVIHNINNGVDAIEKYRPEWKGLRHGLAQLKAIAQRGLKGGGE